MYAPQELNELERREEGQSQDHFVHLDDVTWADYLRLLEIRGDRSAPRMTYLKGLLEIMSPSLEHEAMKSLIGRLIEVYCLERDIEFRACGSWTIRSESSKRGAEPDECYVFGEARSAKRPDLALEVVWSRAGIDKLEVYRELRIREVWVWEQGRITAYALHGSQYEPIAASEVLPDIDLEHLAAFLDRPTTSTAMREYRAALQAARSR